MAEKAWPGSEGGQGLNTASVHRQVPSLSFSFLIWKMGTKLPNISGYCVD